MVLEEAAGGETPRRVLITGMSGSIGQKLRDHLQQSGRYSISGLDKEGEGDNLHIADLTEAPDKWMEHLRGIDVVVHLAAYARNYASWEQALGPNVDGLLNLYCACQKQGVKRIVFASSVWPMSGYRFTNNLIQGDTSPLPTNAYGATKTFGERVGRSFYQSYGIETIVLRLGACLRQNNRPSSRMVRGDWQQSHWLSDRDMCQAFQRAIEQPVASWNVYNVTSAITGSRWDIQNTRADLGFAPQDRHEVRVTPVRKLQALVARVAFDSIPSLLKRVIPSTW